MMAKQHPLKPSTKKNGHLLMAGQRQHPQQDAQLLLEKRGGKKESKKKKLDQSTDDFS